MPKKGGKGRFLEFFGTDFSIIANIINSRIDRSGGNLNCGFLIKNYPDFYSPNIIPALGSVKGKALKNLSDYPSLDRCVTSLGKLAEL